MIKGGLTAKEAEKRLEKYGLNLIKKQRQRTIIKIFLDQLNNFLTILLVIAALVSFVIGERVDGSLILAIVVLNGLFGLYQELKAEGAIEALRKMTVNKIRVVRDNREMEIDSRYLAPGDLMFVEDGVKIPADGRVVEGVNLEVNEAALTGESLPISKKTKDKVYMGTIVTKGRGYVEVTKTGMNTRFGQIAYQLAKVEEVKTPLQQKLEDLSRQIGYIGIAAAFTVLLLSFIQGASYFSSFLLAVALAVAVVPEGLPAVMTITMAIGVSKMAKRKAIVRKLSSIEALGSVSVIATDKTGTLTTNKMEVKEVFVDNKVFHLKSQILKQTFNFQPISPKPDPFPLLVLDGVLCSTASLVYTHDHGGWDVLGDPTEGALLYLAKEVGVDPQEERKKWRLVKEESFDSLKKRMSVLVERLEEGPFFKKRVIFTKGAPESVLEICDKVMEKGRIVDLTEEKRKEVFAVLNKWARSGARVLGFSFAPVEERDDWPRQIFLGMVDLYDPPRPEVKKALFKSKAAGIKTVMITGDNEKTAEAIGVAVGLVKKGDEIISASQLEEYSDEELLKVLPKVKVFARVSPFHKHRIVSLYQKMGEIVAVTGDGVNDAIALKQANIGIAMGLVGTDVARESADIVITDDNFATIVNAIEEGRNITKNLKNAVKYLLSCNVGEAVSLIAALLLAIPHLFYPIQLLYINLITDGFPALALAFSPRSAELMKRPPDNKDQLLGFFDKGYVLGVGFITSIIVLLSYFFYGRIFSSAVGKTAAFSVLTLVQSFIFIDVWLSHRSIFQNIKKLVSLFFIFGFILPFVLQYLIVRISVIASLFKIAPVSGIAYLQFILFASLILIGVKGVVGVFRWRNFKKQQTGE